MPSGARGCRDAAGACPVQSETASVAERTWEGRPERVKAPYAKRLRLHGRVT